MTSHSPAEDGNQDRVERHKALLNVNAGVREEIAGIISEHYTHNTYAGPALVDNTSAQPNKFNCVILRVC